MKSMARALDRRFYGVVEGIVEEIVDPDKEGRVKVSFPWYDDATVTEWCRVRQLYAGAGYGTFFVPEKGDEVLIAFVHGDMRLPIILGGLYNGKDKPPTDRQHDDKKNEKVIRTKAGHCLVFDDTKDKEKIVLTSKRGHVVELHDKDGDGKRFVTVRSTKGHELALDDADGGEKVTLSSQGGHSITLDDAARQIVIRTAGGRVSPWTPSPAPLPSSAPPSRSLARSRSVSKRRRSPSPARRSRSTRRRYRWARRRATASSSAMRSRRCSTATRIRFPAARRARRRRR